MPCLHRGSRSSAVLAVYGLFFIILQSLLTAQASPSPTPSKLPIGRDWLRANKANPDFGKRLVEAAQEEASIDAARELILDFYPEVPAGPWRQKAALLAAQYCELSGQVAAASWYERAAAAIDGKLDARYLLRAAVCFTDMGDYEAALKNINPILAAPSPNQASENSNRASAGLDPLSSLRAQAQLIRCWILLGLGQSQGLAETALGLMNDEGNADYKSAYLFFLAMLDMAEGRLSHAALSPYALRLRAEYPLSAEALLLGDSLKPPVSLAQRPYWLFNGLLLSRVSGQAEPMPSPLPSVTAIPSPSGSPNPGNPSPSPSGAHQGASPLATIRHYQLGSYSLKANSEALAAKLKSAGFTVVILEKKTRDGKPLSVVLVAAGADPQATGLLLKEAGYEPLALFE